MVENEVAGIVARYVAGPWYANEQDEYWTVHASDHDAPPMGNRVCKLPLNAQGAARAHLIAAAPEQLEALSRLELWLASICECDMDEIVADGGVTAAMVVQQEAREQHRRVRAAIAKATGNQGQGDVG